MWDVISSHFSGLISSVLSSSPVRLFPVVTSSCFRVYIILASSPARGRFFFAAISPGIPGLATLVLMPVTDPGTPGHKVEYVHWSDACCISKCGAGVRGQPEPLHPQQTATGKGMQLGQSPSVPRRRQPCLKQCILCPQFPSLGPSLVFKNPSSPTAQWSISLLAR